MMLVAANRYYLCAWLFGRLNFPSLCFALSGLRWLWPDRGRPCLRAASSVNAALSYWPPYRGTSPLSLVGAS